MSLIDARCRNKLRKSKLSHNIVYIPDLNILLQLQKKQYTILLRNYDENYNIIQYYLNIQTSLNNENNISCLSYLGTADNLSSNADFSVRVPCVAVTRRVYVNQGIRRPRVDVLL